MQDMITPLEQMLRAHLLQRRYESLWLELNPLGHHLAYQLLKSWQEDPAQVHGVHVVPLIPPFHNPAQYVEDILDLLRLSFHMETIQLQLAAGQNDDPVAELDAMTEGLIADLSEPSKREKALLTLQRMDDADAVADFKAAQLTDAELEEMLQTTEVPGERELPAALQPSRHPPLVKLRAAALWLREQLPPQPGRLCIALIPPEVQQPSLWLAFLTELLAQPDQEWRQIRWLVRLPEGLTVPEGLRQFPRLRVERWLPSPEPDYDVIRLKWMDETRPAEERLPSGLAHASHQLAHNQHQAGIETLDAVARLATSEAKPDFVTLARFQQGDVFRQQLRHPQAFLAYQMALNAAAETRQPILLSQVLLRLGELSSSLEQWTQARNFLLEALSFDGGVGPDELRAQIFQALVPVWEALGKPKDAQMARQLAGTAAASH